jgi:hypothetical protein
MTRLKKILRLIVLTIVLCLALAGIPVFGIFSVQKRDDLFDNEIKIEQVEVKEEKTELPKMHELI